MAKRKRPTKATKDDSTGKTPETNESVVESAQATPEESAVAETWTADDYDKVPEVPDLEANEEVVETDLPEAETAEVDAPEAEAEISEDTIETTEPEPEATDTTEPEPEPDRKSVV